MCLATVSGQSADSTVVLPEIVVTDARLPAVSKDATARITTVPVGDASPLVNDVADILKYHAGINIRNYGPAGLSSISIRGGTTSQVALVYDGVQLINPQLGELDVSLFGTMGLGTVQVIHGSGSSWLGGHAASGVVSIEPARFKSTTTSIKVGAGSFGKLSTGFSSHYVGTGASVDLSYLYNSVAGDFRFLDDTRFPAESVRRENANRTGHEIVARVAFDANLPTVGVAVSTTSRGLPGSVGATPANEEQRDSNLRIWARQAFRIGGNLKTLSKLSIQRYGIRYTNPVRAINDLGITSVASLEQQMLRTTAKNQIVLGGSVQRTTARHPSLADVESEFAEALYLSTESFLSRLVFNSSLRYDRYQLVDSSTWQIVSPRAGINVALNSSGRVRLKSSVGRSSSVPTFNDRFWTGVGAVGNRELKPESGWGIDAGIFVSTALVKLELTGYLTKVRDQIEWRPGQNSIWTPSNVGSVSNKGLESSMQLSKVVGDLQITGNVHYNITVATDRSDPASSTYGKQLRYIPRQSGSYFLRGTLLDNSVSIAGQVSSARFVTSDEMQSIPEFATLDLEYQRVITVWDNTMTGIARINNIFGTRYALISGYPMPGRNYEFGISIKI